MSSERASWTAVVTAAALAVAVLAASACSSAVKSTGTSSGSGKTESGTGGSGKSGGTGTGPGAGGGTGGQTNPLSSQESSKTKWTVYIQGSVTRQVNKPGPAGALRGQEMIDLNGSVTGGSVSRAPASMVGAMEGELRFVGVQSVKKLGNFNGQWSGKAGMGDVKATLGGPPPLVPQGPWHYTGSIKLDCKGSGTAEWKGKAAPLPTTWDTAFTYKMTITGDTVVIQPTGKGVSGSLSGRVVRGKP